MAESRKILNIVLVFLKNVLTIYVFCGNILMFTCAKMTCKIEETGKVIFSFQKNVSAFALGTIKISAGFLITKFSNVYF